MRFLVLGLTGLFLFGCSYINQTKGPVPPANAKLATINEGTKILGQIDVETGVVYPVVGVKQEEIVLIMVKEIQATKNYQARLRNDLEVIFGKKVPDQNQMEANIKKAAKVAKLKKEVEKESE